MYRPPTLYHSTRLQSWVIKEFLQHKASLILQRFAKLCLKKIRATLLIQSWWRGDPHLNFIDY
jgi:hypothetical protein